jgi:hypothetical protein
VGTIHVIPAGGVAAETLVLTKAAKLCTRDFERVRRAVVRQDTRGYRIVPGVYGGTAPVAKTLTAETPACSG